MRHRRSDERLRRGGIFFSTTVVPSPFAERDIEAEPSGGVRRRCPVPCRSATGIAFQDQGQIGDAGPAIGDADDKHLRRMMPSIENDLAAAA
jgi:hypothetical protein